MRIVIASGKGGTGKTTFAVNMAWALAQDNSNIRLLDCDVEEPNAHLFIQPHFTNRQPVKVTKPVWHADRCIACGRCVEQCAYNALALVKGKVLFFNELCHACGVCSAVCPENAFTEEPVVVGEIEIAENNPFYFAHGRLVIGEARAPTVIKAVKQHCAENAINLIDASPGTACPVVEALDNADVAVLVTEPTPFGRHDLELAADLSISMGIPTTVVINRSDGEDRIIQDFTDAVGLSIAGRIPFRRSYAESYARGELLASNDSAYAENLLRIFERIKRTAELPLPPHIIKEQPELITATSDGSQQQASSSQRIKEVVVVSGKGGTGKTTVAAALSALAEKKTMADCDVDAADLHLLLHPKIRERVAFEGGRKATIDPDQCIQCGLCREQCRFDAIETVSDDTGCGPTHRVMDHACEGCGLCSHLCPVGAIQLNTQVTGTWSVADTPHGRLTDGCLDVGQENSGKLVSRVRDEGRRVASQSNAQLLLADGPPGTSCPVIATVTGADLALVVTEPTVSGVHDLERLLALCRHFQVPVYVIINKSDLCDEHLRRIHAMADDTCKILAEIPFDENVHKALHAGQTMIEWNRGPAVEAIRRAWNKLQKEGL